MTRVRVLVFLAIILVPAGGFATLAWADKQGEDEIAHGVRVAGVDVGGLTEREAIERVYARLRPALNRSVRVRVGKRRFALSARRAKVRLGLDDAVRRAHEAGRGGNVLQRGWRRITGGRIDHDEDARITLDKRAVSAFVARIHRDVSRRPVDAALELGTEGVSVTEARRGRRLAGGAVLERRLRRVLLDPRGRRTLIARTIPIEPEVTREEVWDANPVVVTVSRSAKSVRVFQRGKLAQTYRVAVGQPGYPTPLGRYAIQSMVRNPSWNVPTSDWAGDLAGQTIPPGDPRNPLKAAFIRFNGAVGFHGTASIGSLGTAASHGCVRMSPGDVMDLFGRVKVGTPVFVGD
ncbi:MAG TPA: L,D-transpeptidase family protein [Solirubrobacteraceae bacterium]|jgi:hypothetical protein